jgi:hypothetical protein
MKLAKMLKTAAVNKAEKTVANACPPGLFFVPKASKELKAKLNSK